jgi:GNAT superfamily N-acetyltransferase
MKSPQRSFTDPDKYRYCHIKFSPRAVLLDEEDPEHFVQEWAGHIEWTDAEHAANPVLVGAFSLYFVDLLGAELEGFSPFEVFDAHQQTFDVFQVLFDLETSELLELVEVLAFRDHFPAIEGVLIVNQLMVLPEHRGNSVGLAALKTLIEQFRARATITVLKAAPLQFEKAPSPEQDGLGRAEMRLDTFSRSMRVAESKLKRHFERLGFTPLPDVAYMVLDPSLRLPTYNVLTQPANRPRRAKPNGGPPKLKIVPPDK